MAVISFHLRNKTATEPTPIFMSLYADGQQTKIKTGLRVDPKQWSFADQKCKTRGKGILATNGQTNADLAGMAKRAEDYYGLRRVDGIIPTGAEIWDAIKPVAASALPPDTTPKPLPDFSNYLVALKSSRTPNTIKAKRTTYNHLLAFSAGLGRELLYADFTRDFKDRFAAFLSDDVRLADNTLAKQITVLRGFLAYAIDHGRTAPIDFKGWTWKYKEPDVVTLTESELRAIEQLRRLPEHLENARDLFLLMCYTGLRYSDAVRLRPEYDKGDYLELTATKTDEPLTIYIRRALRPLLSRYWAGKLRPIQNRALNEHIKVLAQRAGIDTPTEVVRYYKQTSLTVKETQPKHELLGCHSARRTFVTLSIARDVPSDVVMQATGHKNYRTMQRYNKTTAARQVDASRKAWGEE